MEKSCGKCSHSLESEMKDQVFCIANPPICIINEGRTITVFPTMMEWGKCDGYEKGKTQKMNKQPPEILEPALKVVK